MGWRLHRNTKIQPRSLISHECRAAYLADQSEHGLHREEPHSAHTVENETAGVAAAAAGVAVVVVAVVVVGSEQVAAEQHSWTCQKSERPSPTQASWH